MSETLYNVNPTLDLANFTHGNQLLPSNSIGLQELKRDSLLTYFVKYV